MTIFVKNRTELLHLLPKNAIVAEIGVYRGDYADEILQITNPSQLYLIDLWSGNGTPDDKTYTGTPTDLEYVTNRFAENKNVHIRKGFDLDILKRFPDKFFNWSYLDTSHDYEQTLKELIIIEQKTKDDGWILGHDYIMGHYPPADPQNYLLFGVIQAVHVFCTKRGWKLHYLSLDENGYYSYGLKKN